MTDYKSEFVFQLSNPLEYHEKGQIEFANELTLKAPSNRQRHQSAKLKQGFFRAIKSMADNTGRVETNADKSGEKEEELTGESVIEIIMMSSVDLVDYQESFRELILNDVCYAKEQKLTAPMYDKLSDNDTEKLMGEYIANFLLSSHLAKMGNKKK